MKGLQLGNGVVLRPAICADLPSLLAICLQTGDSGKDATNLHNLHELVGDIYVAPYVIHEPDFAFSLTIDGTIIGYLLGVLDTAKFEAKLAKVYWPATKAKYDDISVELTPADIVLIEELVNQGLSDQAMINMYPSHLHIDISKAHQGFGYGKMMIDYLLDELRTAGSTGVHLHLSASNHGALVFYQKLGFELIFGDLNEIIMGVEL